MGSLNVPEISQKRKNLTLFYTHYLINAFYTGGGAKMPPQSNSLTKNHRNIKFGTRASVHQNFLEKLVKS